jgi:hypothetical protein
MKTDGRFFAAQLQPSVSSHPLARGEHISRYVSAHEAVVTAPSSRRALMFSQLPLIGTTSAGVKAPVNLDLRKADGSYRPVSSAVSLNLPATARGEARFPGRGFGLSLGGHTAVPAVVRGQELFYANTDGVKAATDEVVRAAPMGLEVSWVLRSKAAARTQDLRFDLAPGQRLSQPDSQGVVQILSTSGATLAAVSPPATTDAVGQQLQSTVTVIGSDVLAIHVQIRSTTAYPILIDPTVAVTDAASSNLTSNGWKTFNSGYSNEFTFTTSSGYSYTYGPKNCAASCKGNYGEYYYPSLPGAFIYEEYETGVFDIPYSGSEEGSGIFGPASGTFASGSYRQTGQSAASGPYAFRYDGASESNYQVDYCAGTGAAGTSAGSCPISGTGGVLANNTATAAVMALTGATGSSQPIVAADGATLYQSDNIVPSDSVTSYGSYTPGTWTNSFSSTVSVSGSSSNSSGQPGLGYGSTAFGTNTTSAFTNPLATQTACTTGPCFANAEPAFNYSSSQLPEGSDQVCVQGKSFSGNLGNNFCWTVDIDRTPPPAPTVTGLSTGQAIQASSGVSLAITDPDPPAGGANASSGPSTVSISVDGGSPTSLTCKGSCSWSLPSGLAQGQHAVVITATDVAGNTSAARTISFIVDNTAPTDSETGQISDVGAAGTTSTLTVTGSDNNGSIATAGVKSIELQIDGQDPGSQYFYTAPACPQGSCDVTNAFTVQLAGLSTGQHTLTVIVTDWAGNTESDSLPFVYNPNPPQVSVTGPASNNGAVLPTQGQTFTIDATESDSGQDGYGIDSATVSIDGTVYQQQGVDSCDTGDTCDLDTTFDLDDAHLSDGTHTVSLVVADVAGNATTTTWQVVADSTPPAIQLSGLLDGANGQTISSGSYPLNINATDATSGVSSISVSVDGTTVVTQPQTCSTQPCPLSLTWTYNPSSYNSSPHAIVVHATDVAGNTSTSTINVDPDSVQAASTSSCPTPASGAAGGTQASLAQVEADANQVVPNLLAASTSGQVGTETLTPALQTDANGLLSAVSSFVPSTILNAPVGDVAVGSGPSSVCLGLGSVVAGTTTSSGPGGDSAISPNINPSTDLIERAAPMGVEETLQLRDASAPTSFTFNVGMASGAQLQQLASSVVAVVEPWQLSVASPNSMTTPSDMSGASLSAGDGTPEPVAPDLTSNPLPAPTTPAPGSDSYSFGSANDTATEGTQEISEYNSAIDRVDGEVDAVVWAPTAVDADGNPVPVSLSTNGSQITLQVSPNNSTVYPVEVDPTVVAPDPGDENDNGTCSASGGHECAGEQTVFGPGSDLAFCSMSITRPITYDRVRIGPGYTNVTCGGVSETDVTPCVEKQNSGNGKLYQYYCLPSEKLTEAQLGQGVTFPSSPTMCFPGINVYRSVIHVTITWAASGQQEKYFIASPNGIKSDCAMSDLWTMAAREGPGRPSVQLRANLVATDDQTFMFQSKQYSRLPDQYFDSKTEGDLTGFDAHHIVPAADGGQSLSTPTEARALAYLCGPYQRAWNPNDPINGIMLRGYKLQNGTESYDKLDANDMQLQYHGQLRQPAYYSWLVSQLSEAVSGSTCNASTAENVMYYMAGTLKMGNAPPAGSG